MAILPGSDFGRSPTELTARLAFVDFDGTQALANYPEDNRLDQNYLENNCGKTMQAVDLIVDWLESL